MSKEPTIHVRVVSDDEIPVWARLTARTVESGQEMSEAEIAAALAEGSGHTRDISRMAWLVESDGGERPVARLRQSLTGTRAEIWGLGIAAEAAAQGLERPIVRALADHARAAGVRHLLIQVGSDQVALLTRAGFRLTRARVDMVAQLERRPASCGRPLRHPRLDEQEIQDIGRIYYEGYLGTIDDDGATPEEALEQARRCLAGDYGEFLPDCSYLLDGDNGLAGAALITVHAEGAALLAEVMILPAYRGRGYARPMIQSAMNACLDRGLKEMWLAVTRNNVPAEGLYRRMGFAEHPGSEVYHLEKEL